MAATINSNQAASDSTVNVEQKANHPESNSESSSKPNTVRAVLSRDDVIELQRFSQKKSHIEQQIKAIQRWPTIQVFQNVDTYLSDHDTIHRANKKLDNLRQHIQKCRFQRDQIETDANQFNVQDMNRLRKIAKAASKGHMSDTDTDLIEITLEAIYALDKLLRLLRDRKTDIELATLRLDWETDLCHSWAELAKLQDELDAFVTKRARWLSTSSPKLAANQLELDTPTNSPSPDSSANVSSNHHAGHKLSRSITSRQMATEMVELEASRLDLRIRILSQEAVPHSGRLLDALIDQCQVPDKLIDEQEKLENSMPALESLADFAVQLAKQWQLADRLSQRLTSAKTVAKNIEADVHEALKAQPTQTVADSFNSRVSDLVHQLGQDLLFDQSFQAGFHPAPSRANIDPKVLPPKPLHPNFPEQAQLNENIEQYLLKEAHSTLKRAHQAAYTIKKYSQGFECFSRTLSSRHQLSLCRQQLADLCEKAAPWSQVDAVELLQTLHLNINVEGKINPDSESFARKSKVDQLVSALENQIHAGNNLVSEMQVQTSRCQSEGFIDATAWTDLPNCSALWKHVHGQAFSIHSRLTDQLLLLVDGSSSLGLIKQADALAERIKGSALRWCSLELEKITSESNPSQRYSPSESDHAFLSEEAMLSQATTVLTNIRDNLATMRHKERMPPCGYLDRASQQVEKRWQDTIQATRWARTLRDQVLSVSFIIGIFKQLEADLFVLQEAIDTFARDSNRPQDQESRRLKLLEQQYSQIAIRVVSFEGECLGSLELVQDPPFSINLERNVNDCARSTVNDLWLRLKSSLESVETNIRDLGLRQPESAGALVSHDSGEMRQETCELAETVHSACKSVPVKGGASVMPSLRKLLRVSSPTKYNTCKPIKQLISALEKGGPVDGQRLDTLTRSPINSHHSSTRESLTLVHPENRTRTTTDVRKQQSAFHSRVKVNCRQMLGVIQSRAREGKIPMQTTDIYGVRQQRLALTLPSLSDLEQGRKFWQAILDELNPILAEIQHDGDRVLVSEAQSVKRDLTRKAGRFDNLCLFSGAAEAVEKAQSVVLMDLDLLEGRNPQLDGTEEMTTCLSRDNVAQHTDVSDIADRIKQMEEKVAEAERASALVKEDVRVRQRLGTLQQSVKEIKHLTREAERGGHHTNGTSISDETASNISARSSQSYCLSDSMYSSEESLSHVLKPDAGPVESSATKRRVPKPYSADFGLNNGLTAHLRMNTRSASEPFEIAQAGNHASVSAGRAKSKQKLISPQTRHPIGSLAPARWDTTPRKARQTKVLNNYQANPKSKLDVAVGRIVNQLPVRIRISQALSRASSEATTVRQALDFKDESGQYWVGDPDPKLCFCRILRSKTVMVRVGGGWQELSQFIMQHFSHLSDLSITPTTSPQQVPNQEVNVQTPTSWLRSVTSGSAEKVMIQQQRASHLGLGASPTPQMRSRAESMPKSLSVLDRYQTPMKKAPTLGFTTNPTIQRAMRSPLLSPSPSVSSVVIHDRSESPNQYDA